MLPLLALALLGNTAADHHHGAAAAASCPPNAPNVQARNIAWNGTTWTACEDTIPGGDVVFIGATGHVVTIGRRSAVRLPLSLPLLLPLPPPPPLPLLPLLYSHSPSAHNMCHMTCAT